ncbi:MAG: carboxypeptidase M32, partial [Planctomycetota bacterium]
MGTREQLSSLRQVLAEVSDISSAQGLLSWDQETCMPKRGLKGRSEVMSTLAGINHRKFTDPAVGGLLEELEGAAEGELSAAESALVREVRRDFDRSTKIPETLIKQIVEARALALPAWQEARAESRFETFAPHLERLLDLKRQEAEAVGYQEAPFDALLDQYEAGMKASELKQLFLGLRQELQPFVRTLLEAKRTVDTGPVKRRFDETKQREFSVEVARAMGFDFESGRVDRATHPFCTGIHTGDVRLTWRSSENDLRPAFFGIVHEAGHGLYEQGLSGEWEKTPLGEAVSLGVHESQSRLWENMVARGRPFWIHFLPVLKKHFPGLLDDVDPEGMYRAVNEVTPSFIRVEADELTYNLHILLRFEVECALFRGALSVKDLP